MQGLFEDIRSMKRWHVQCRHATGMTGSRVALTRVGCAAHMRWWRRALIIILTLCAILVEGQSQPLAFLSTVTEPHTHHLKQTQARSQKEHRQKQELKRWQAGSRTSLSKPRSSDMWVISRVFGLGHLRKYDSRAVRTEPSRLVLLFLFLVSTKTRSTLYICGNKPSYSSL